MLAVFSTVFSKIYAKFGLEPQAPHITSLYPGIVPTTNVDKLLDYPQIERVTTPSSTSVKTIFTVPAGERWEVSLLSFQLSGGDRDLLRVRILDGAGTGIVSIGGNVGTSDDVVPGPFTPIALEEGWAIDAVWTGGTTDGNWYMGIHRMVCLQTINPDS